MPVIEMPDGQLVNFPEDTPKEEILALIEQVEASISAETAPAEPEVVEKKSEEYVPKPYVDDGEDNFFTDLYKGFVSGAVNTGEVGALGISTMLEEEAENATRNKIKSLAESVRPEGGDVDDWAYKIAAGIGSVAGIALPAAAAAALAPSAAAATVVGTGVAGLLGLATASGEASERAREANASVEDRVSAAAIYNPYVAAAGALEALPVGRFLKSVNVPVLSDLVEKFGPEFTGAAMNRVQRAAATGGVEAAQEMTSEILQNLNEKYGYNPDRTWFGGTGESGAVGGATGAIIQLATDALLGGKKFGKGRDRSKPKELEEAFEATDEGTIVETDAETTAEDQIFTEEDAPLGDQETLSTAEVVSEEAPVTEEAPIAETPAEVTATDIPAEEGLAASESVDVIESKYTTKGTAMGNAKPFDRDSVAIEQNIRENVGDIAADEYRTAFDTESYRRLDEYQNNEAKETPQAEVVTEAKPVKKEDLSVAPEESRDASITVENTKNWANMIQKARAIATESSKDGPKVGYQDILAGLNLPTDRETYEAQKAVVVETAPAPVETDLDSAKRKVAEGVQYDQLTEPEQEVYVDKVLTPIIEEQKKKREAGVIPEKPVDKVTTTVTPDKELAPVVDTTPAKIPNVYSASVINRDGTVMKTTAVKEGGRWKVGGDFRNKNDKSVTSLIMPDGRKPGVYQLKGNSLVFQDKASPEELSEAKTAVDKRVKELKDLATPTAAARTESPTPDKKLTRDTKPTSTRGDPVEKIGKTLGLTKIDKRTLDLKGPTKAEIGTQEKTDAVIKEIKSTQVDEKKPSRSKKERDKDKKEEIDKQLKETVNRDRSALSNVYKNFGEPHKDIVGSDTLTLDDKIKVLAEINKESPEYVAGESNEITDTRDITNYFKSYERPVDAIAIAVHEFIAGQPQGTDKNTSTVSELAHFKNLGQTRAKKVLKYVKDNLSPNANKFVEARIVKEKEELRRNVEASRRRVESRKKPSTKSTFEDVQRWLNKNQDRQNTKEYKEVLASFKKREEALNKSEQDEIINRLEETAIELAEAQRTGVVSYKGKLVKGRDRITFKPKEAGTLYPNAKQIIAMTPKEFDALIANNPNVSFDRLSEGLTDSEVDVLYDQLPGAVLEKLMTLDAVLSLDAPVHPLVDSMARQGNLQGTLEALQATTKNNDLKTFVKKFIRLTGTTKIQVVPFLTDSSNNQVAGLFDPKTNTIKLDAETGINPHVIMHEMTHAVTSAEIANKSSPLRKQLNVLFNNVKDSIDTVYGGTNLDEFAAEAASNPKFLNKLAKINIKGSPINGFVEYMKIIGNFLIRKLNLPIKTFAPERTAATELHSIIEAMMAPAPDFRYANDYAMDATQDGVKKVLKDMGDAKKNQTPLTSRAKKQFVYRASQFLIDAKNKSKAALLSLMHAQPLAEIARDNGFGQLGFELETLIYEQRGAMAASDIKVKAVVDKVVAWTKTAQGRKHKSALDRIIYSSDYGSTIWQVNPLLSRLDAEKQYGKDSEKMQVWKDQRKDWNNIGEQGRKAYVAMRNAYKDQYMALRDVVGGQVDSLLKEQKGDEKVGTAIKNKIFAKMFDKATLDVYFPLLREGTKKLQYQTLNPDKDNPPFVVRLFNTDLERSEAQAALDPEQVDMNTVEIVDEVVLPSESYKSAPPLSFAGQTLEILQKNNVSETTQNDIMELFIDTLPETSFAKSLQGRKGTGAKTLGGYIEDSVYSLQTKAYDLGTQTVRLTYGARLRDVEKKIKAALEKPISEVKVSDKTFVGRRKKDLVATRGDIAYELDARSKFTRNGAKYKTIEKFVKTANQIAFIYTIGTNFSSAAVNLTQIPLVVYPYLGAEYGYTKAFTSISSAYHDVTSSYTNKELGVGIEYYFDRDKEGNYTIKKDLDPKKAKAVQDLAPLIKGAAIRNELGTANQIKDSLGLEEGGRKKKGNFFGIGLDFTTVWSAFFFSGAEKLNRQVTMVASYRLILERLNDIASGKANKGLKFEDNTKGEFVDPKNMSPEQIQDLAVREALYQTRQTNGGAILEAAPRIAQSGVGRVALMYKNYGLNMYTTMIKTSAIALDSEKDPQLRKVAAKQMAGLYVSSAFFAGAAGVPLYGAVVALVDLLLLDDDEEDADTLFRKLVGENFYKGVPAMLGVDISDRVKLTDLLIQNNKYNQDDSVEEDMVRAFGGPAWSVSKRIGRGVIDINEGEIERGMEQLVPAGVANMLKTTIGRYQGDGGIFTRRGDPIYDDITGGELAWQFLGFPPTKYTFAQEKNQSLKGIEKAVNEKRSKLLKQFYVLSRRGIDTSDNLKEILKFNKRHPYHAISSDSINKSYRTHARTSALMHNGVTLSPRLRAYLLTLDSQYSN